MARIILGNDHGAVELKRKVESFLKNEGHEVVNTGINEDESVDYPDQAALTCNEFLKGNYDFGILFCGTGIGISISANKIDGIRCALPQNTFAAQMAKEHNNANFLAFGGRIDYPESVEDMIKTFMNSQFAGDRHERRVEKIMELEHTDS